MNNRAAWIKEKKGKPLQVDSAPYEKPGPGEIVVKNAAVAINPLDWKVQDYGMMIERYPNILGTDIAGEVFEVGEGVTRFKKGQRVIGHQINLGDQEPKHGAFQLYPVAFEALCSPIPDDLSYEQAVVLPLSISTASYGLYVQNCLALPLPTTNPKPTNKTILIWGASSSVGSSAVQLATASGITVVAAASKRNHECVKALGAKEVLDYHDPAIIDNAVAALKKGEFAGIYDAICAGETLPSCVKIAERFGGCGIACALSPYGSIPESVKATFCLAFRLSKEDPEAAKAVWEDFIPHALASGQFKAKPDPIFLGKGLEAIQEGMDRHKQGVSAAKVVVTL